MKKNVFIAAGICLIVLFPIYAFAENPAQPDDKQHEPSAQKQADNQPNDTDHAWKEQLEKKHVKFIEWLQANYPEKAAGLLVIRDEKPDEFVQQLGTVMKVYEPIQKTEHCCPDLAAVLRKDLELQDQRDKLITEINQAEEQQRPALIKQLREIVETRFDIIIQKKQLHYDHLLRRLEKLKQKLEEQAKELEQLKAEKDQSIEQRMKELTEGTESLDW